SSGCRLLGAGGGGLRREGGAAGEGEEHVVEGRLAEFGGIDGDGCPGARAPPARAEAARAGDEGRKHVRGRRVGPGQADLDAGAAYPGLERAGGAPGDDAAVVDDPDLVG